MANNAPKLNGFTFTHPPETVEVSWEPQLVKHKLADGALAVYNKGFKLLGKLKWNGNSWLTQPEYSAVMDMYNQLTATGQYYPKPDSYPARFFGVQIVNDFNFVPMNSLLDNQQCYVGSIVFETSIGGITATASEIF